MPLADPAGQTLVIEHPDRLMRFGCEYVQAAQPRRLVMTDLEEVNDVVQHLGAVLTSSCAQLNAWRSARNRAERVRATTSAS